MVTWQQTGSASGNTGVYAQRYDANGVPAGTQVTVQLTTVPALPKASLSDGSVLAVWRSQGTIHAQRYDGDGKPATGIFEVATYKGASGVDTEQPNVTGLSDGRYLVTWSSKATTAGDYNVYGQIYSADNTAVGGPFTVSGAGPHNDTESTAIGLADGGFVVAWKADNNRDGSGEGVYLRRYDASGQDLGGEVRINDNTAQNQRQPSLVALPGGDFAVGYTSWENNV